ncbi:MAG: argininosuccinate synthase [Nitrospirales bacterium]|nr:argininosuccinate synthase [Nitrospira sp.]MDR4460345.1 argininosuccinate synthase [Nitrospirales bacterium]MDR4482376.1 argininosuccinate synthase [Nitrospirales bacterium]
MDSKIAYQKIASHEAKKGTFDKCVLLYSGGLDTSIMLKWIQEAYACSIVALTVDVGQLHEDLEAVKAKAIKLGAEEAVVIDAREEFAEKLLSRAIKANADYQGGYPLSTPLARVTLSEIAVRVAKERGIKVVAHGSTGKGNDQVRFENYITTLDATMKVIAPVREWSMGRDEQIDYAKQHDIPIKQNKGYLYSHDDNMWGSTNEGGDIEDPARIPDLRKFLQVCIPPEQAPDEPEIVEVGFDNGIPCSINGEDLSLCQIIERANAVGARHGVGIVHLTEDRLVGLKVRGVYEAPGAEILIKAHFNLEKLVNTRDLNELKKIIDEKWAYTCYGAKWFDPSMDAIHAFQDSANQRVKGRVKVKLFKGKADVVAMQSPYSLFDANLATFNKDASFNQNASAGFIEIYNLAQKTYRRLDQV